MCPLRLPILLLVHLIHLSCLCTIVHNLSSFILNCCAWTKCFTNIVQCVHTTVHGQKALPGIGWILGSVVTMAMYTAQCIFSSENIKKCYLAIHRYNMHGTVHFVLNNSPVHCTMHFVLNNLVRCPIHSICHATW